MEIKNILEICQVRQSVREQTGSVGMFCLRQNYNHVGMEYIALFLHSYPVCSLQGGRVVVGVVGVGEVVVVGVVVVVFVGMVVVDGIVVVVVGVVVVFGVVVVVGNDGLAVE